MLSREKMLEMKRHMKSKLMAAVAMLLISTMMLTATSYAWFTLSTAPEVTELKTTAGANGALEIALQSTNTAGTGRAEITSGVGTSSAVKDATVSNTYWGSLIDLSSGYGLDHVTLYPSRLSVEADTVQGQTSYRVLTNSILAAPQYGTDGRVVSLAQASKTHYNATGDNAGKFTDTANWGVNVIGFAKNGDEAEDNSFTRAYSRANVLAEATQKVADYRTNLRAEMEDLIERNSLGIFGWMTMLAGAEFVTQEQLNATVIDYVASMDAMIGDAADAVRWALLANAVADSDYKSNSEEDMRALGKIYKEFLQYPLISEDESVTTIASLAADKYPEIAEAAVAVATAQARIAQASSGTVGSALLMLVNEPECFIYGAYNETHDNVEGIRVGLGYDFSHNVTKDSIFMVDRSESNPMAVNLFSSLATVLGDYSATMKVWIVLVDNEETLVDEKPSDDSLSLEYNFDIKATNKSSYNEWSDVSDLKEASEDANIGVLGTVYQNVSAKSASGDILMPITRSDITAYGYSVDFAFQASESTSLVLQQDGIDRASSGNEDERLEGAGSTMTFTLPGDLSHEQAEQLIQCVNVVFMNTQSGTIYKVAAAKPTSIDTVLGTATATLQLYEPEFVDGVLNLGASVSNNVITDITKDTPYYITAVVYLNGDKVDSGMFTPSQVLSLDGAINLQFASSTQLQPMNYSSYYTTIIVSDED